MLCGCAVICFQDHCVVDFKNEIIMKKIWDKIPSQYQGYLVGIFLFLVVILSMWSILNKISHRY